jgi:hypothetical protein
MDMYENDKKNMIQKSLEAASLWLSLMGSEWSYEASPLSWDLSTLTQNLGLFLGSYMKQKYGHYV